MKPNLQFICLLLIIVILFGCSPENYSSRPYPATAAFQVNDSQPTSTPIQPTSTLLINLTNSSPTALPTLETSEAYLLLQEFIKNDPPCQLPCWGGVIPGVSTVLEAEKEFMKLTSISSKHTYFGQSGNAWFVGSLQIFYPLINTQVELSPGFLARSDDMTVINIRVYTQSLPHKNPTTGYAGGYGDKEYNALLAAYTMPEIFTTYGLPNLIYTRADINAGEPTAPDFFVILLLYLDRGIFISYTMPMEEKGDLFVLCPSESKILLDLTPQDIGENYQNFFEQFGAVEWTSLQESHYQLLEDAIGMTNEEFSKTIISSPESCFGTPKDIWPDP